MQPRNAVLPLVLPYKEPTVVQQDTYILTGGYTSDHTHTCSSSHWKWQLSINVTSTFWLLFNIICIRTELYPYFSIQKHTLLKASSMVEKMYFFIKYSIKYTVVVWKRAGTHLRASFERGLGARGLDIWVCPI